jgi:phosphoglucomutase
MDMLRGVSAAQIRATELAGDRIATKLTAAHDGGAPFGGIKVSTAGGWFAARPSGTEAIYKLYAESFRSAEHLVAIQRDAAVIVEKLFGDREVTGERPG